MRTNSASIALVSLALFANGCAAIEGIFKAGVWVGILAVALVIGIVAFVGGLFRRSRALYRFAVRYSPAHGPRLAEA